MNDRERLIELVENARYDNTYCNSDGQPVVTHTLRIVDEELVDALADYLIANGVIVQKHERWTGTM